MKKKNDKWWKGTFVKWILKQSIFILSTCYIIFFVSIIPNIIQIKLKKLLTDWIVYFIKIILNWSIKTFFQIFDLFIIWGRSWISVKLTAGIKGLRPFWIRGVRGGKAPAAHFGLRPKRAEGRILPLSVQKFLSNK